MMVTENEGLVFDKLLKLWEDHCLIYSCIDKMQRTALKHGITTYEAYMQLKKFPKHCRKAREFRQYLLDNPVIKKIDSKFLPDPRENKEEDLVDINETPAIIADWVQFKRIYTILPELQNAFEKIKFEDLRFSDLRPPLDTFAIKMANPIKAGTQNITHIMWSGFRNLINEGFKPSNNNDSLISIILIINGNTPQRTCEIITHDERQKIIAYESSPTKFGEIAKISERVTNRYKARKSLLPKTVELSIGSLDTRCSEYLEMLESISQEFRDEDDRNTSIATVGAVKVLLGLIIHLRKLQQHTERSTKDIETQYYQPPMEVRDVRRKIVETEIFNIKSTSLIAEPEEKLEPEKQAATHKGYELKPHRRRDHRRKLKSGRVIDVKACKVRYDRLEEFGGIEGNISRIKTA